MADLILKKLQKSIENHHIISDFDLTAMHGEMVVIVGPSGCGKSTLLRMIAGLEELTAGEIWIGGKLVNKLEPKDRNIAMVFQNYALYPHMTVYDNMAYGLRRRRLSKAEIDQRIQKTAEILRLEKLMLRKPKKLSGGQRQRVAMGRAIVRKPALFLFDEPLSNLDANLRTQMRLEIRKLQRELNTTTIYVTHDQVEAMTLADKIVIINQGRIEQIGTPYEVYHKPNNMFVAGFMGSPPMNFLQARMSNDGLAVTIHGGTSLPLRTDAVKRFADQPIILGIRPESIIKAHKEGADRFNLKIDLVEILGSEQLIYGKIPGDNQTFVIRLPLKVQAKVGEQITLGVMPDSLHLFSVDTQERIPHD